MAALDNAKHRKHVADMLMRETARYERTRAFIESSICAAQPARLQPLLEANAQRIVWLGERLLQLAAACEAPAVRH